MVEQQSGQSLPDYITEHILTPLKLTHTSFPTTSAFPDPHAQGYTTVGGRDEIATGWNQSWAWAAGNMVSTLDDMRIWARALATGELLTGTHLPRREAVLISDFQRTGWKGDDLDPLPEGTVLKRVNVGRDSAPNLAIVNAELTSAPAGTVVRARIAGSGITTPVRTRGPRLPATTASRASALALILPSSCMSL